MVRGEGQVKGMLCFFQEESSELFLASTVYHTWPLVSAHHPFPLLLQLPIIITYFRLRMPTTPSFDIPNS